MAYSLNPQQTECVFHGEGPLLVLAGAGSGKTGVIVNRIHNLLTSRAAKASEICAVTFTNKAAREMRERVRLLSTSDGKSASKKLPLRGIFIGTFHSLGLMVLRENFEAAGIAQNFTIQGQDDQLTLGREILVLSGVDTEIFNEKQFIKAVSDWKNSNTPLHDFFDSPIWVLRTPQRPIVEIVEEYIDRLRRMNALDFDDLILLPTKLLEREDGVRQNYQERFRYFLADEFQDTNPLQFRFLTLLMKAPMNLCAVGDDDQSIYSWRGADTRIMLDFKARFANAKIIALEENYRSEQYVLDIANHLIAKNTARHAKTLFSAVKSDGRAKLFEAEDGLQEAEFVADTIVELKVRHRIEYSAFAVLYRTNFQSRSFEEVLRQRNIPYHVSGSYQFYDRSEIKDVLAYLRFLANHADDRSLMRILNLPRRGISAQSIERLLQYAELNKKHLWDVVSEIEMCEIDISASTLSGILEFRDFVQKHVHEIRKAGNLTRGTQSLVDQLELEREYIHQKLDQQKVTNKLLNIRELLRAMDEFEKGERPLPMLDENAERNLYTYLQFVALLTADDKEKESETPKVELMTIHQAKGLEFDTVFITGLEDGVLPHQRSLDSEDESAALQSIEEERRLMYVALTRAKKRLYLTHSRTRKNRGFVSDTTPSRFLDELPEEHIEWENSAPAIGSIDDLEKMLTGI